MTRDDAGHEQLDPQRLRMRVPSSGHRTTADDQQRRS